jgi:hypothetical protein
MDVQWKLLDVDEMKEKLGFQADRDLFVKQGIFVELEADGSIAGGPNKNVKLGKVREAVGQNKAGKPWAPRQLIGAGPCIIRVTQRPDKDDPEVIYNDVGRVAAA